MSAGEEPLEPCCKDMAAALSFETGRHFFVEDGELRLLVAHTPLLGVITNFAPVAATNVYGYGTPPTPAPAADDAAADPGRTEAAGEG